jgi:hypothetical protein
MFRPLRHSPRQVRSSLAVVIVVVTAAAIAGCSAAPGTTSAAASPGSSLSVAPSGGATESSWPVPDAILAKAILEAAREASVAPLDVVIVSAEPQTWNDGSLGCPKPGLAYTQSIVEGYHVVVTAGDRTLDYRFGHGDDPVLCVTGAPGKSGYGG